MMVVRMLYSVALFFCLHYGQAQVQYHHLGHYTDSILQTMPGSGQNDFRKPTSAELTIWQEGVEQILNDSITKADATVDSVGYNIVRLKDTLLQDSQLFYVLKEQQPKSRYWGTYVFHPDPCRDELVIQAPHPKYDLNTGREGIYCFRRLSAGAFMMSGTHRCNHQDTSACSGVTSVCGNSSAPYRISDMAHNIGTAFQKTTNVVQKEVPSSVFCQLHGFGKQPSDPYVIMSNGTRVTPTQDYIQQLKTELGNIDSVLTFKIAHKDTNWHRLIGFTNVQGRLINNSPSPCSQSADSARGRFIHLEQERTRLRADSSGWQKMYRAMKNVFPCQPTSHSRESTNDRLNVTIYPNPATERAWIQGPPLEEISVVNRKGEIIDRHKTFGKTKIEMNLTRYDHGLYFVVIHTSNGRRRAVKLLIGN